MSFSFFFLFIPTHFNFFLCQDSPNSSFFLTFPDFNDAKYKITVEQNDLGMEFASILNNKTEITLDFIDDGTFLTTPHIKNEFNTFTNYKFHTGTSTYAANTIVECLANFHLIKNETSLSMCYLVAHFDQPNYPTQDSFYITFKAGEITTDDKEDDNEADNDFVVNVLLITSIVSLIILYYLLLLLWD